MSPTDKSLEKESKLLVTGGRGKEEWGATEEGSAASFQNDENILELYISDSHRTLESYILWYVKCISMEKKVPRPRLPQTSYLKNYVGGVQEFTTVKLSR